MVTRIAQEKTTIANDIRIRYLDWEGSDPPIILLHNNRGAADPWRRFVATTELPNRFIAPDQRGCGATDKPATGYSVWDLAADVAALIEMLGSKAVPIVGCAIGGSIGLAVAANYPAYVSALVMLDSGFPIFEEIIHRSVSVLRATPHEFKTKKEAKQFVRTLPDSLGYSWSPIWEEYFEWTFQRLDDGQWAFKYDQNAMLQATAHLSDDLWPDAQRVQCPVLVAVAGESGIISVEDAQRLAQAIPRGSFMELPGIRHLVILEGDLGPVEAVVREYLQKAGAIPRGALGYNV
jgi:pimeloyl-ACP methyl ester carboxylesterase